MKTLGLIGGMSWESTATYYRLINQKVRRRLGGQHSARLVIYSVDFHEIESWQHAGEWDKLGSAMIDAAHKLEAAGAEAVVLCTNTMHKLAPRMESEIKLPFLHIADATGEAVKNDGLKRVGLLGTRFTMEEAFYKTRLTERFGIEVLVPPAPQRKSVHEIIYHELCLGHINESSRQSYLTIIEDLTRAGAEAVILGCTEIGLLVNRAQTQVPLFDTTEIHAQRAVDFALSK